MTKSIDIYDGEINNDEELVRGDSKKLAKFIEIENNYTRQYFKGKKLEEIYSISPKLKSLVENIKRLDKIDLAVGRGLFKHYIYSRPKGYNLGITLPEAIFEALQKEGYEVLRNSDDSKTIIKKFNSRTDNVRGEKIRFLGLSNQYKEGIDLFDVKYAHIFEVTSNDTDLEQIIGRGTRFCGQKGLEFPWLLNVFIYRLSIPRSMRNLYRNKADSNNPFSLDYDFLSDLYNDYRVGYDEYISKLSKYAHYMSIDFGLTQNYIPLKDIGNLIVDKIELNEEPQRTTIITRFKPYDIDIKDKKRMEDEDAMLDKIIREKQTAYIIQQQLNNKSLFNNNNKSLSDQEIISKTYNLVKEKITLSQIPSEGIMSKIVSFFNSLSLFSKNDKETIKKFKIINEKECQIKIGRAKEFPSKENDKLISYPVPKGDKIYMFCFSHNELVELINKNEAQFTNEIMIELKNTLATLYIDDIKIEKQMTREFIDTVLYYNDPLINAETIDNSLITIVLDMMIPYFENGNVVQDVGLFYKFINISANSFKLLFRYPLKFLRWILSHKMFASVFFILMKLIKIMMCVLTGNLDEKFIKYTIQSIFKKISDSYSSAIGAVGSKFDSGGCTSKATSTVKEWKDSAIFKALETLIITILTCIWGFTKNMALMSFGMGSPVNVINSLKICLESFAGIKFNLSTAGKWIMDTVVGVMKYSLTMISQSKFDFSRLLLLNQLIEKPFNTVSKLIFGPDSIYGTHGQTYDYKKRTLLENLTYYLKNDLDMLTIAIILQLIPYNGLKWFIAKLIDLVAGSVKMVYIHKLLTNLYEYVNTFKGAAASCLDLIGFIARNNVHAKIQCWCLKTDRTVNAIF